MARVTTEDCLKCVDNRFELVLLASRRARELYAGANATVSYDDDKPAVVALREIAASGSDATTLSVSGIKSSLVKSYQQHLVDEPGEDDFEDDLS